MPSSSVQKSPNSVSIFSFCSSSSCNLRLFLHDRDSRDENSNSPWRHISRCYFSSLVSITEKFSQNSIQFLLWVASGNPGGKVHRRLETCLYLSSCGLHTVVLSHIHIWKSLRIITFCFYWLIWYLVVFVLGKQMLKLCFSPQTHIPPPLYFRSLDYPKTFFHRCVQEKLLISFIFSLYSLVVKTGVTLSALCISELKLYDLIFFINNKISLSLVLYCLYVHFFISIGKTSYANKKLLKDWFKLY